MEGVIFGDGYRHGMLRVQFVTLFPEMVLHAVGHSMLRRASEAGLVSFEAANPRSFATDRHRTVDDKPFAGGPGMLLKAEPVAQAIESLGAEGAAVVFAEPTGPRFEQRHAHELAEVPRVIFVCGHYEGIDERVRERFATHTFSLGDFVLTGGELAALTMADAVVRLVPGVLGSEESLSIDSHADGLLSAPQYTRPERWRDLEVPSVLLSGDHQAVSKWKRRAALRLTRERRPDLFCRAALEKGDLDLLSS